MKKLKEAKLIPFDNDSLMRINKKLQENELPIKVGDIILDEHGNYYKIVRFQEEEREKWIDFNKGLKEVCKETIIFVKANINNYDDIDEEDLKKFDREGWKKEEKKIELERFNYVAIPDKSIKEFEDNVKKSAFIKEIKEEKLKESDSTELGFRMSSEQIMELKNSVARKKMELEAKERILYAMLNKKRNELSSLSDNFKKQLKSINRAILSIELYLGVGEKIAHLLQGENAFKDSPICIRQMLLYMDEEVAEWRNEGLDFESIDLFDTWIKKDRNFEKLLPEKKGVVGIRIRRTPKEYTGYNPILKAQMNEINMNCYFLIRNGENVYSLWTQISEVFPDRLFPQKMELQLLLDKYVKENSSEYNKEKLEDKMYAYKRIFLVLKGIIERTDIFKPFPNNLQEFDIFKPSSYGDFIQYIYDDEASLPSGRLTYKLWKNQLNKEIKRGSRIYVGRNAPYTGNTDNVNYRRNLDEDRLVANNYINKIYDPPPPGLYTVEEGEEVVTIKVYDCAYDSISKGVDKNIQIEMDENAWHEYYHGTNPNNYPKGLTARYNATKDKKNIIKKFLYIKYNPGGEVVAGWYGYTGITERKNKISYKIYEDDNFIFNYDALPFEDIDFYLESRIDRPNYLQMIPTLIDLKALRMTELEWEKHFVNLTINEIKKSVNFKDNEKDADIEILIWLCIDWWKKKVIWKRPISKDDFKALRMIKQRVLKILKTKGVI